MYKGIELDLLHEEVRELRYELSRLQVKEDRIDEEVKEVRRHRRQGETNMLCISHHNTTYNKKVIFLNKCGYKISVYFF